MGWKLYTLKAYVQLREQFVLTRPLGGLTGIVLSNAGLDVAFHDKKLINRQIVYKELQAGWGKEGYLSELRSERGRVFSQSHRLIGSLGPEKGGRQLVHSYIGLVHIPAKLNMAGVMYSTYSIGYAPCSNYHNEFTYYNNYTIKPFFIGLLEGDGTLTMDLIRNHIFRLRINIVLKKTLRNFEMLKVLSDKIGGSISTNKKFVTLLFSSKKDIKNVLSIIQEYPFLTSRKICQLNFAKKCLNNEIKPENFIKERNLKYKNQKDIYDRLDRSRYYKSSTCIVYPTYFPYWLSGFIEAEGCFSLLRYKKGGIKKHQFSIGQNYDSSIINVVRDYFESKHLITKDKNKTKDHYRISIGGQSKYIIYKHFKNYPLLGEKLVSYKNWVIPSPFLLSSKEEGRRKGGYKKEGKKKKII